jgi:restriction system protein
MWMVRAGRDSVYAEDFLQHDMVSVGWESLGPIGDNPSKKELEQAYRQTFPRESDGAVTAGVGQIYRFYTEIQPGDAIVTYDRDKRLYYVGEVVSGVAYTTAPIPDMPRVREVRWTRRVSRDRLSVEARNTLGAIQTLFLIKPPVAREIAAKAVPLDAAAEPPLTTPAAVAEDEVVLAQQIRAELIEKAEETIEDRIVQLSWDEMQELVAGILRAMGYRTTVSPRGPDRGYDVFASPDGLGLEEPRIFVEVKHRPSSSMGSQDLRSFIGGRTARDRCLYISTGGFTKDARYEADRASVPLNLLGLVDLRRLLVEYYDQLDESTRSLIPLKRVYVLAD